MYDKWSCIVKQRRWCVATVTMNIQYVNKWMNINTLFIFYRATKNNRGHEIKLFSLCDVILLICQLFIAALIFFFSLSKHEAKDEWQRYNVVFSPNRHFQRWYGVFLPLPSSTVLSSLVALLCSKPLLVPDITKVWHEKSFKSAALMQLKSGLLYTGGKDFCFLWL